MCKCTDRGDCKRCVCKALICDSTCSCDPNKCSRRASIIKKVTKTVELKKKKKKVTGCRCAKGNCSTNKCSCRKKNRPCGPKCVQCKASCTCMPQDVEEAKFASKAASVDGVICRPLKPRSVGLSASDLHSREAVPTKTEIAVEWSKRSRPRFTSGSCSQSVPQFSIYRKPNGAIALEIREPAKVWLYKVACNFVPYPPIVVASCRLAPAYGRKAYLFDDLKQPHPVFVGIKRSHLEHYNLDEALVNHALLVYEDGLAPFIPQIRELLKALIEVLLPIATQIKPQIKNIGLPLPGTHICALPWLLP